MVNKKIKLLAVDDNPDNLITIKAMISDILPKAQVFTSSNGKEALEHVVYYMPDIILLDIIMPEMDGFEVCHRIKSDDKTKDIPIIFLTALKEDKESRIRALEVGADAFLSKPIDETELTAQLRAMIKIKEANDIRQDEKERLAILLEAKTFEIKKNYLATLNILEDLKKENEARKITEKALIENEIKYNAMISNISDVIGIINEHGIVMYKSPNIEKHFGWKQDELVGQSAWLTVHKDDFDRIQKIFYELLDQDNSVKTMEYRYLHKDGTYSFVELTAINLVNTQIINGILINYHDISERMIAQTEIERAFHIVQNIQTGLYIYNLEDIDDDRTLKMVYANSASTNMTGVPVDDILHKYIDDIFPNLRKQELPKIFAEVALSGIAQEIELVNYSDNRIPESYFTIKIFALPDYNVGIAFDNITEKRLAEIELIKAKNKAEESERLKTAFLANMSHEIRTPMNGIIGFANLLKEPNLTGEEKTEFIQNIDKSSARMLNIINDIIAISKIESNQVEIHKSETSIKEILDSIYIIFKSEIESKGLEFKYNQDIPFTAIITDVKKVNVILSNLVKNSIKFTDYGFIEIGCSYKKSYIEFYVKDSGIGIGNEQKKVIFERFRQGSETLSRKYEGAGLGLSISKAYVELLGGSIWLDAAENEGSCFSFSIPYDELIEETDKSEIVIKQIIDKSKLNILIAEDDPTSEKLMQIAVKDFASNLYKARTGLQAIDICKEHNDIDLIMMDLKMPEMSGYEATSAIREFNEDVIIIAQTAFAFSEEYQRAIDAGCNDYITKPYSKKSLKEIIKKYINI